MTVPDVLPNRRKGGRSRAARRAARGGALSNTRQCKARPITPEPQPPAKIPVATPMETAPPLTRCCGLEALQLPGVAAAGQVPQVPAADDLDLRKRRSVSFDLEAKSEHEVTPYGEIYGLHPSEFMFERNGFIMLVTDADLSDEDEDDADDDEEDDDCMEDNWVVLPCS